MVICGDIGCWAVKTLTVRIWVFCASVRCGPPLCRACRCQVIRWRSSASPRRLGCSRPGGPRRSSSPASGRFALVAVEPASRRGVAIARYEPGEQDGAADVAIAVTPGWRHVGLATELLRMLAQAASERGIHTFTGMYLADNRPVTALINGADEPADQVTSRGITEFSVPLPPDRGPEGTITRGTGK